MWAYNRKLIPENVTYTNDLILLYFFVHGLSFLWFIIKLYIFLDRSLIFINFDKDAVAIT